MAGTLVRNPHILARLLGGGPAALRALEAGFATVAVVTPIKTGSYTAADGDFVPVDATGANRTVTLPAPAAGARVVVKLLATAAGHTVTVARSSGGVKIDSAAADVSTATVGTVFRLYSDGTDWYQFSGSGATGSIGPQGVKGDKGDKGDTGDAGPAGPADTVVIKTTAYNAVTGDLVLADATGGDFSVTLPAPTLGAKVTVKSTGTGTVTVLPNGVETIEGAPSKAIPAGASAIIVADGTNWWTVVG